ncbi:predicted protein [Coccidioides posadasii str. Silveira]|uniref:Predicted protein n=1 Tax=Coccidioides posadasii (strain RMSCC 757 / Silveira) TaxID=443226 RepID=E9DDN2_COCPS|nr:predicted protein [Coccidioides posadasii str. Silveira]
MSMEWIVEVALPSELDAESVQEVVSVAVAEELNGERIGLESAPMLDVVAVEYIKGVVPRAPLDAIAVDNAEEAVSNAILELLSVRAADVISLMELDMEVVSDEVDGSSEVVPIAVVDEAEELVTMVLDVLFISLRDMTKIDVLDSEDAVIPDNVEIVTEVGVGVTDEAVDIGQI